MHPQKKAAALMSSDDNRGDLGVVRPGTSSVFPVALLAMLSFSTSFLVFNNGPQTLRPVSRRLSLEQLDRPGSGGGKGESRERNTIRPGRLYIHTYTDSLMEEHVMPREGAGTGTGGGGGGNYKTTKMVSREVAPSATGRTGRGSLSSAEHTSCRGTHLARRSAIL